MAIWICRKFPTQLFDGVLSYLDVENKTRLVYQALFTLGIADDVFLSGLLWKCRSVSHFITTDETS
jgi:hypothetical protein